MVSTISEYENTHRLRMALTRNVVILTSMGKYFLVFRILRLLYISPNAAYFYTLPSPRSSEAAFKL